MLIDKLKKTIRKFGLLKQNDRVIVGISGGPDSVALILSLRGIAKEFNLTLHACHLDHMLRKDSAGDAAFVRKLCEKLSVPVTIEQIPAGALSQKGCVEELARSWRLKFFFKIAKEIKAGKIALGHNFDDQAETVLMRLLRGSGLSGLSGILPKRTIDKFTIIRPLLEIRRSEIEKFLRRKKIIPRIDKSNFEDIYLRNRLRHYLLPLLEKKYNRNIKETLCNTGRLAADDYDYLIKTAMTYCEKLGKKISIKKFEKLHPAIQKLVLRLNFQKLKGDTRTLSARHIEEIEDMVRNRPLNSIVDLTSGISVIKKKAYFIFYRR